MAGALVLLLLLLLALAAREGVDDRALESAERCFGAILGDAGILFGIQGAWGRRGDEGRWVFLVVVVVDV